VIHHLKIKIDRKDPSESAASRYPNLVKCQVLHLTSLKLQLHLWQQK